MIPHTCNPGQPCGLCALNRKPLPQVCAHRGGPVPGPDAVRDWRACEHPDQPLGPAVCGCRGCGPRCPGYTEDAAYDTGPPPVLPHTSSLLVCTVATGPRGAELLTLSEAPLRAYAGRCGADFYAFTGPLRDAAFPLSDKFALHHLRSSGYRRVLYVDADVLTHPAAPSLFDLVPAGHVGIYDDRPETEAQKYYDGLQRAAKGVLAGQGESLPPNFLPHVFNSGVVLWEPEAHPGVWQPPDLRLKGEHVAEQVWVQRNVTRYPVFPLPRAFNYQWWGDKSLSGVRGPGVPWFLHLAGMTQMHTVPGWNVPPPTLRAVVMRAAAWMGSKPSEETSNG